MDLHIDFAAGEPRRDAIYRQIRSAVLDGRLRAGAALPPTRELAARLAVSRNTVSAAYDRLTAEGFLAGRVGSGTFVRDGLSGSDFDRPPAGSAVEPVEVWDRLPEQPRGFAPPPEFDFRTGVPDLGMFPFDTWRRLVAQQLRVSNADILTYVEPGGHPPLREAIARQAGVSRNVRTDPADVLVTSGTQQALDLIARVLLRPGETAAVEDPGYPPPRLVFTGFGARVAGVPVDAEGIVVDAIPPGTRLVYVTPSHQFPLGIAMSMRRRMELIAWAERQDAVIVEDDYDTEFRFTGRPMEPLHSLDGAGRVIYVGSFSKVLYPALRLGYLIAPPSLRSALRKAKYLTDWHSPGPAQAALARFLDEGAFARHVRKMRREYRARHELVTESLKLDFADVLTPVPCSAGLHLSAIGECGTPGLVRAARASGVFLYRLGGFSEREDVRPGLVFGYGAIRPERIRLGLRRLRVVLDEGTWR
ncbi:PLP-dependent aminotransferase family protein [Amycolatopsis anabasis]|uniref:MocR-like pyridoxine biosynthesis transcription factor PdxR n=1 Tax=Amycolatopsis anabasis TaxID=1840409 RepID=UPI00131BFB9E|nr:PLP-dependent aminotransferase family protein [Amycolatopsis anabasis]